MRHGLFVLVPLVLVLASPAAAAPVPRTETADSGPLHAELSYLFDDGAGTNTRFQDVRLRITRAGVTLVDTGIQPRCAYCSAWPAGDASSPSIRAVDLDGDREPEVVLDLYTGGAHCCFYSRVYRYAGSAYSFVTHVWGDPSYSLRDLNHDGRPEWITADDRFAYAFSCFACSALPVQVLSYKAGLFTNVTRRFPPLVRKDAAANWRFYLENRRRHFDTSGVLPAYLADEELLGHGAVGWKRVRTAVAGPAFTRDAQDARWKNRSRYLSALRRFLVRAGYVRSGRSRR
ncbi:MAG: hypothetical protein WBB74_11475 [Gaiellaceae bacterium]